MSDAEIISEITRKEPRLIYYLPEEIEKYLRENRGVIIRVNGKIAAFCFWAVYGDWVEAHTIYVYPEFRGQGYFRKALDVIDTQIKNLGLGRKIFIFTRVPQAAHVVKSYGFKNVSYWYLPIGIWLRILRERLKWRKIPSHLKHGLSIFSAMSSRLFVREIRDGKS